MLLHALEPGSTSHASRKHSSSSAYVGYTALNLLLCYCHVHTPDKIEPGHSRRLALLRIRPVARRETNSGTYESVRLSQDNDFKLPTAQVGPLTRAPRGRFFFFRPGDDVVVAATFSEIVFRCLRYSFALTACLPGIVAVFAGSISHGGGDKLPPEALGSERGEACTQGKLHCEASSTYFGVVSSLLRTTTVIEAPLGRNTIP